jgi:hypothetical protein
MSNEPVCIVSSADIEFELQELHVGTVRKERVIQCTGIIKSRRRQKNRNFFMLEVQENGNQEVNEPHLVQVVVDDHSEEISPGCATFNHQLEVVEYMRVGGVVKCTGYPGCDRINSLSLYLRHVVVMRCSSEPDAIRRMIAGSLIHCGTPKEWCSFHDALNVSKSQFKVLQDLYTGGVTSSKEFSQAVSQLSRTLVRNLLWEN